MAETYWVKFQTEAFLQGVRLANMTSEEIGVYMVVLSLIAARSGPIENDSGWINSYAGCSSTRKCTAVLQRLIDLGKLEMRDGLLGNTKMLRTVEERNERTERARNAAMERWHPEGSEDPQPELELETGTPLAPVRARASKKLSRNYPGIYPGNIPPDKSEINAPINSKKRQNSAIPPHADAYATRARDSESRDIDSSQPNSSLGLGVAENHESGTGGVEDEKNIEELDPAIVDAFAQVCHVSGFHPRDGDQVSRNRNIVADWIRDGFEIEQTVLPTIRKFMLENEGPTRTLSRFTAAIKHEHARRAAQGLVGHVEKPPQPPVLEPEGENPIFKPMREALLEMLGPKRYAAQFNRVTFEKVPDNANDPIRVKGPPFIVTDIIDAGVLRQIAKQHGFKELWNG